MKEGLVRLTGEKDLFYDNVEKLYRYRMHCHYCGKYSGCWCFKDLDSIPLFEEEFPNSYCSDLHFVLDTEDLEEIANEMGITIKPTMEECNASKIVKVYMEYADYPISGWGCSI